MRALSFVLLVGAAAGATSRAPDLKFPSLPLGRWQSREAARRGAVTATGGLVLQDGSPGPLVQPPESTFPAHRFEQRTTHFPESAPAPEANRTFPQRYWFDASHYKDGGPVFLLDGGETSGEDRIPFLETGILHILAEATGGIGIVLEHRYYGSSFPLSNLSADSLRYLDTAQSLADSAYFARSLVLPGYEHLNITAPHTPWIYYGGSYAGAKAAFMMKEYPDVIWGSIASSAVTHAQVDYWEYYDPIRTNADPKCMTALTSITKAIDAVLRIDDARVTSLLKYAFGLTNVTDNRDFVNVLAAPLGYWQERNWDPAVSTTEFDRFCSAITGSAPSTSVMDALRDAAAVAAVAPFALGDLPLREFAGYAAYFRELAAKECDVPEQDKCFGTGDSEHYREVGLEQSWRSWMWQVCTEWGYFQGGAPVENVTIVSRLLDVGYNSRICRFAFGDAVPKRPNVTAVNRYGDFGLSAPRLAFVDGSADPWLPATPHSPHAPPRPDTLNRPFKLIPGGVHHWDENGLAVGQGQGQGVDADADGEPPEIRKVHAEEIEFVTAWLDEFVRARRGSDAEP